MKPCKMNPHENPADYESRGLNPSSLKQLSL